MHFCLCSGQANGRGSRPTATHGTASAWKRWILLPEETRVIGKEKKIGILCMLYVDLYVSSFIWSCWYRHGKTMAFS